MTPKYKFRLPQSFNPAEFLPQKLMLLTDDASYFVSLLMMKFARRDVDENGMVRLMAKHLRTVMHNRQYAAVIEALLERGAVVRSPYFVGERAFGYTLADRFRRDTHVGRPVACPRLIGRLHQFHTQVQAERRARMLPVHDGLEQRQRRLQVDGGLAREIIAGLPPESNPFDAQGILVADIEDGDFHLNVGRYGRVTNNITSMKRKVRAALRCEGDRLCHADIACCQPALIAKKMTQQGQTREGAATKQRDRGTQGTGQGQRASIYDAPRFPPGGGDLGRFCALVQLGQLYDHLLAALRKGSCPNLTREQLKQRFLADVIAKRKVGNRGAEYPSAIEDCFRHEFPTVYQFIRAINRDGWQHENLIRLLQREESRLVIETVSADLLIRHPRLFVLTLHDAIFTTERGIPRVVAAFDRAFEANGFAMTLKVAV